MKNTTLTGLVAQNFVVAYLKKQRFTIVAENWRNRWSEIDIIAHDKKTIVFIEVKYRRSKEYGDVSGAISADKKRRLRQAAVMWCSEHGFDSSVIAYRIDVAFVTPVKNSFTVEYIANAIGLDESHIARYT